MLLYIIYLVMIVYETVYSNMKPVNNRSGRIMLGKWTEFAVGLEAITNRLTTLRLLCVLNHELRYVLSIL